MMHCALREWRKRLTSTLAQPAGRRTQAASELSEDLRMVIDRGHHTIDDRGDVVEASLQHRQCLYALDVERHFLSVASTPT